MRTLWPLPGASSAAEAAVAARPANAAAARHATAARDRRAAALTRSPNARFKTDDRFVWLAIVISSTLVDSASAIARAADIHSRCNPAAARSRDSLAREDTS